MTGAIGGLGKICYLRKSQASGDEGLADDPQSFHESFHDSLGLFLLVVIHYQRVEIPTKQQNQLFLRINFENCVWKNMIL